MVNLVKAQLSKINHDYVIDVGCGNGDSLRCWDKPSVGVNITPREVELAKINGDCILGDAEDKDCFRGIIEARGRDNRAAVAAVDCAYHFSSRSNFFKNCKDFGFDVVVTDVVLKDGHGWLRRKLIEMACKIAGIPRRNVLTKREYREVRKWKPFTGESKILIKYLTLCQGVGKYGLRGRHPISSRRVFRFFKLCEEAG